MHSIQNRIGKHFEANGAVAEKTKVALKAVEDFFEKRALQVPIIIRSFAINSVISWINGANKYTRWQSLRVVRPRLLPGSITIAPSRHALGDTYRVTRGTVAAGGSQRRVVPC